MHKIKIASVLLLGSLPTAAVGQVSFQSGSFTGTTAGTDFLPAPFAGMIGPVDGDFDVSRNESDLASWSFGVGYLITGDQSSFGLVVTPGTGLATSGTSSVVSLAANFTANFLVGPNGWNSAGADVRVTSDLDVAGVVSLPDATRPQPGINANVGFATDITTVGSSGYASGQIILNQSLPGPATTSLSYNEPFANSQFITPGRVVRVEGQINFLLLPAAGSPSSKVFTDPWNITVGLVPEPALGTSALAGMAVMLRRRSR
jgi:hypothetical protein